LEIDNYPGDRDPRFHHRGVYADGHIWLIGHILTLLAIVLSIGLVCDDAIVVLENIHAKVDLGIHPVEAAQQGMKEIYFAVISTTIVLASGFLFLLCSCRDLSEGFSVNLPSLLPDP